MYNTILYRTTYSSTRAVVYTVYTAEYVYSMYAVSTVFYYRYDMQKYAKEYAVRQKTRYYLLLFCKRRSWSFRSVIVYPMYNFSWPQRICAENEIFQTSALAIIIAVYKFFTVCYHSTQYIIQHRRQSTHTHNSSSSEKEKRRTTVMIVRGRRQRERVRFWNRDTITVQLQRRN